MAMKLFDSLSREARELRPAQPDGIFRFYNCGPTVYASAHIGNFRTFVINDVLRRLLELEFPGKVKHVRNLTDVDDRTIGQARRLSCRACPIVKLTDPLGVRYAFPFRRRTSIMSTCSRMWPVAAGSTCGWRQLSATQSAWNRSVHFLVISARGRLSCRACPIVRSSTSVRLRTCFTFPGNSSSRRRRRTSLMTKVRKLPMWADA